MAGRCVFCDLDPARLSWASELVVALRDAYPVSPGHTLILPRRHVPTWFDASAEERRALWEGVEAVKEALDREFHPDGYNVGFNAGEAAGQTVMHLHVHVIPRYHGDVDDPRGGVRGVIPGRQKYDPSQPPQEDADPFAGLDAFVPGEDDGHLLPAILRAMRVADEIDIVAAFIQETGVRLLEGDLVDALARQAKIRILTGDYLGITHPHALQRLYTLTTDHPGLQVRLYRVAKDQSFHPKAYIFLRDPHGAAFVGSSNLSRSALTSGVEWNLRSTHRDPATFRAIRRRFDRLFHAHPQSVELTAEVVAAYQHTIRVSPQPEPAAPPPEPHAIQQEVLRCLRRTREEGFARGLVVMATGLGKTFLAAFDFLHHGGRRALFVAHREEILRQAADAWARVLPDRSIGFLTGGEKTPDAEILFASIFTIARDQHLRDFSPEHFDYVVVDEFHHAAATSYRRLLAHFRPRFMLGLTATPDRADGAALLELCDDNLVTRVGLVEGIERGLLVPFHYFGVRDSIDFEAIPWQSGRFDPGALDAAVVTRESAAQALREYLRHAPAPRRSLIFCCSVPHADHIAAYFREQGVAAEAVHSRGTSAPRAACLERLRRGEIEAIVAVDVFNEGVDLPDVNTILMLRPTESPVVFLQQLGRGLRRGKDLHKPHLRVIDFIGNHRAFLARPQALLALTGKEVAPGEALRRLRAGALELPPGCSVDVETEALDLLDKVSRISREDALIYAYRQIRDANGRRPTARELLGTGITKQAVRKRFGTWFDFVAAMNDLRDDEKRVLSEHRPWFQDLSETAMSRSYKMVVLQVLDDLDALHGSIEIAALAERCRDRMRRDPLLRAELAEHEAAGGALADFVARWRQMPLMVFHEAKGFSRRWFAVEGARVVSRLDVATGDRPTFDAMTAELVDLRLREYLQRERNYAAMILPFVAPIELAVGHGGRNPVLQLDRRRRADIPEGDIEVEVDGESRTLRFEASAVRTATARPGGPNLLPTLLRGWFGPTAGQPGTAHRVELARSSEGRWILRPRREAGALARVIPLGRIPYYPELAVACGVAPGQVEGHDRRSELAVEAARALDPRRHFIVRASGDSMDGGERPIRDGDLVLCEWATISDPRQIAGEVVLVTGGAGDEVLAAIKRPVQQGGRWVLRSDNPAHADQRIDPTWTLRVVARVLEVVRERTDPVLWGTYDRDAIAGLFGKKNDPSWRTGHRDVEVAGEPHTILMVNLHKDDSIKVEHRYADRFLSPSEFQWESQATTKVQSAKGQRILHHAREDRRIHLFVRYHARAEGKSERYTYCGTLQTERYESETPIRVWFRLEDPLPRGLWQAWSDLH